jgi:hypothetical protein
MPAGRVRLSRWTPPFRLPWQEVAMTTTAAARRSHILSLALALVLASPAFAATTDSRSTPSIKDVVKAGDVVAVTRWSGGKVKGQVLAATGCALVLRADGRTLGIPNAGIKTLRRYPARKQHAKATLEAVERCDRIECSPGMLAVVGLAGLFKGLQDTGRRPEVVYRAASRANAEANDSLAACGR